MKTKINQKKKKDLKSATHLKKEKQQTQVQQQKELVKRVEQILPLLHEDQQQRQKSNPLKITTKVQKQIK